MEDDSLAVFVAVTGRVRDLVLVSGGGVCREREWAGDGQHAQHLRQCRHDYRSMTLHLDADFVSYLTASLVVSETLRRGLIKNFNMQLMRKAVSNGQRNALILSLKPPERPVMDLIWCQMINLQLQELAELSHTMSWLSTLGGGFSALGDYHDECAEVAGKISKRQLAIAHQMGDPIMTAKCRLYAALSLIQLGRLKSARRIIEAQYHFARSLPEGSSDIVLHRMCLGIWSKLKYEWMLKHRK